MSNVTNSPRISPRFANAMAKSHVPSELTKDELSRLAARGYDLKKNGNLLTAEHWRSILRHPVAFFPGARREALSAELTRNGIPHSPSNSVEEMRQVLLELESTYYRVQCKNPYGYIGDLLFVMTKDQTVQQLIDMYNKHIKRYSIQMIATLITLNGTSVDPKTRIKDLVTAWRAKHYGPDKYIVEVTIY